MAKILLGSLLGVGLFGASVMLYITIDSEWIALCDLGLDCKSLFIEICTGPWGSCLHTVDDDSFSLCSTDLEPYFSDPIGKTPTTSGLMVASSVLGLFSLVIAVALILCTYLGYCDSFKKNLAVSVGGVLMIISGLFGLIVTVWMTTAIYGREKLIAIKPPMFIAWVGVPISLLGGIILTSYALWKECRRRQAQPSLSFHNVEVDTFPMDPAMPHAYI
ncbi:claudin-11-like [Festucalex cinctus]